jgi:hypothetical protein
MKKQTFAGKSIIPARYPQPKPGQVWESENKKLVTIISTEKENAEVLWAVCQNENGERFSLGCGWFNNKEYTFIGTLITPIKP